MTINHFHWERKMFRIFIFAIILFVIFVMAYKLLNNMHHSRMQKRIFKQHNPDKVWRSIYKPAGIIAACGFAVLTNYLYFDAQYLLAFASCFFIAGSIWVYKQC